MRKTSWVPELRSRTTSAIHPKPSQPAQLLNCLAAESTTIRPRTSLRSYDGHLLPQWAKGKSLTSIHPNLHTSIPLYIHTSITTPHPAFGHLLPQGAKGKSLAAQLPSCSAAKPTTSCPRTSLRSYDANLLLKRGKGVGWAFSPTSIFVGVETPTYKLRNYPSP